MQAAPLRLSPRPALRFACFALLALAALWPYLSQAGALNDFRDAHVLRHYEDAARRSVVAFGQAPLWDPYYCGGLYALGTPQARFASPSFLLTALWGTQRGEALTLYLMLLLGLEGAYRYLRARGESRKVALLCSPVFGLSGIFACAPFLGWTAFYGFALLPWALWGARRAARGEPRGAGVSALALAWMVGFGGTYVAPLSALACGVEWLAGVRRVTAVRALWAGALLGALALGLGAVRLWPLWETLRGAPRVVGGGSGLAWTQLPGLTLGYWPPFVSTETWYLVGLPAGLLALAGLRHRRARGPALAVLTCLWLAMGYHASPSLFEWVRALPVFDMLRSPERFLVVGAVPFMALVARGLAVLSAYARRRPRLSTVPRLAVAALALNCVLLGYNFHVAASKRTLVAPPVESERAGLFRQARGNRWALAHYPAMGLGSLSCWEAYPVPQSRRLRAGLPQEVYLEKPEAGAVQLARWSPNALVLEATLRAPARVLVNQNHHAGWRASAGRVVAADGLLAVELPEGTHRVELRFLPRSAVGGALTSVAALLAALWLATRFSWRDSRRRRVAALVLAFAPLSLGALVAGAWSEGVAAPALLTPEGEPVVADAPGEGARPSGARFEGGVVLEAARVSADATEHRVRLELDWRTEPGVGRKLGFFASVEPDEGSRLVADHALVSGVLALERAPAGRTLRDVTWIHVPVGHRGKTWKIWVGLWELRGDGSRKQVLEAPHDTVRDNAVLAGTVVAP